MPRSRPARRLWEEGQYVRLGVQGRASRARRARREQGAEGEHTYAKVCHCENNAVIAHEGMVALLAGSSQPTRSPRRSGRQLSLVV